MSTTAKPVTVYLTETEARQILSEVQYRAAQADYEAGLPWHDNDRIEQTRLRAYADSCQNTAHKLRASIDEAF